MATFCHHYVCWVYFDVKTPGADPAAGVRDARAGAGGAAQLRPVPAGAGPRPREPRAAAGARAAAALSQELVLRLFDTSTSGGRRNLARILCPMRNVQTAGGREDQAEAVK